jgi:hypothetical protein
MPLLLCVLFRLCIIGPVYVAGFLLLIFALPLYEGASISSMEFAMLFATLIVLASTTIALWRAGGWCLRQRG